MEHLKIKLLPEEGEEGEYKQKSLLKVILALFLVFLLLVLFIPVYKIKTDPEPDREKIPSSDSLLETFESINSAAGPLENINQKLSIESMPLIRGAAVKISTDACKDEKVCYVKALYYFSADTIKYVEDPAKQYIQHPVETLVTGGGDCEDKTLLLAYLLKSINVPSRICLTSNHAFLEAWLPEATRSYKHKDDWVILDPTAQDFGKKNYNHIDAVCEIYI